MSRSQPSFTMTSAHFVALKTPTLALLVCCFILTNSAYAQQAARIIDGEPYDMLILKKDQQQLKLQPIEMKKRMPLKPEAGNASIIVRLFDKVTQKYEIAWADIESIKLFEELVIEEGTRLVEDEKFDDAYEHFQFVESENPEFPGVSEAFQKAIYQEAVFWHQQERIAQSLALLNEVYNRNPKYEGLEKAIPGTTHKLIKEQFEEKNYLAMRRLLGELESKFPTHQVVMQWQKFLESEANSALDLAKKAKTDKQMRLAHQWATKAVERWPAAPGATDFLDEIHQSYPVVSVGVRRVSSAYPGVLDRWVTLRQQRLTDRLLSEAISLSETQSKYASPFGKWTIDGGQLTYEVQDNVQWSNQTGKLTSYDVASAVQQLATTHPDITSLIESTVVKSPTMIELKLKAETFSPESYLQLHLAPWSSGRNSSDQAPTLGGYFREAGSTQETKQETTNSDTTKLENRFVSNPHYFAKTPTQPAEVIERNFSNLGDAIQALRKGEIVAVDRVAPWEIEKVRRYKSLKLHAYSAPTVHFLLPNLKQPLMSNRGFRRAISYGIHRELILQQHLYRNVSAAEGEVLYELFPVKSNFNSQPNNISYNPRLMLVLMGAVLEKETQLGRIESVRIPPLTLIHPNTEVAKVACREIQAHLQLVGKGLTVNLKQVSSVKEFEKLSDWDLMYVELSQVDPLVDALRLFGDHHASGKNSNDETISEQNLAAKSIELETAPWAQEALQEILLAKNQQQAQDALAKLNRMISYEQMVIPLWQMPEHFITRETLQGVEDSPVTLYQSVEEWKHPARIQSE